MLQVAPDDIENDDRHRMPDVGIVVNGRTADVHPDQAGLEGLERFLCSGKGVVDSECHDFKEIPEKAPRIGGADPGCFFREN
jgi:hypothetical protein